MFSEAHIHDPAWNLTGELRGGLGVRVAGDLGGWNRLGHGYNGGSAVGTEQHVTTQYLATQYPTKAEVPGAIRTVIAKTTAPGRDFVSRPFPIHPTAES